MPLSDKLTAFIRLSAMISILLLTGCASTSETNPIEAFQTTSPAVNYALSLQGAPYIYGQSSPEKGFDCSGFVKHVYEIQGIHLPRTSFDMAQALPSVDENDIHPGDLVFFDTDGHAYSHVGIYVNRDKFIHAPSRHTGKVLISSLKNDYWQRHYTGARRPR